MSEELVVLSVGTRVKLASTGEVGIVIHTWLNEEVHAMDCYVAFFGQSFPERKPDAIPYVLRYFANSLDVLP